MKILLDTHIWIWSLADQKRLSKKAKGILRDFDNEFWLSPISLWECLVLEKKGRLKISSQPFTWVKNALKSGDLRQAPLINEIAIESRSLDYEHEDPADRFLAATARVMNLKLLTLDRALIESKAVPTIDAR